MSEDTEQEITWSSGEPGETARVPGPDAEPDVLVIPAPGDEQATAQALLDAAEDPLQVRTGDGGFLVPASVADAATLPKGTGVQVEQDGPASKPDADGDDDAAPPAKKAPAKKAAPRKAASK